MQTPGTKVFSYGSVSPGKWVVGLSQGYAACTVFSGDECVIVGGGPIITMVGTSR